MSQSKKEILKSFVKEHAKSSEEIKAEMKAMEEVKKQYTQDVTKLEDNLRHFNERLDPLLDPAIDNPADAVLCWVRRPTQDEWESMIPEELRKYDNPEDVPKELADKYKTHQFEMMADLVMIPKHDAEWWRKNGGTIYFQQLFQSHIVEVYKKLGIIIGNF
jgi:hypothetical protein